jgi:hypothetical protein
MLKQRMKRKTDKNKPDKRNRGPTKNEQEVAKVLKIRN